MRFLIDTHCWLWTFLSPERLNDSAAALMASEENTIVFSAICAAEIALKVRIGKLQLPDETKEYVASGVKDFDMKPLPLYLHHALRVAELPLHHRDPFDRLLIAQAQAEGLPLMTADPRVAKYDLEIIWAGRGEAPKHLQ